MHKSSVYLPERLKARLAAFAVRAGRSEADVIRAAILRQVAGTTATTATDPPVVDPPRAGRLVGVGVGPGPADLITVRALRALRRADRVMAPCSSSQSVGRAEAVVREAAPDVVVERVTFVMHPDHNARADALNAACDAVAVRLEEGEEIAFITLGDPNTYSTFSSVAAGVRRRRPSTTVETVPGVMAFQDLAARACVVVTDEQQSLHVVPANGDVGGLAPLLADDHATVVVYKGGGRLPDVAAELRAAGRLEGAMLGELLGMPGERITPVATVADRPASYLSAVIAPAPMGGGPSPVRSTKRRRRVAPS